jgi:hypothetical protein
MLADLVVQVEIYHAEKRSQTSVALHSPTAFGTAILNSLELSKRETREADLGGIFKTPSPVQHTIPHESQGIDGL